MISKQGWLTLIFIVLIIPLGFFTKFYSGPAMNWISNSIGGLIYEIFWCLVLFFLFPKASPILLASIVFISTCILEFLQLWHPLFLESLRSNFIGRTILGNAFNWMDFPYYLAGSILGYFILRFIARTSKR